MRPSNECEVKYICDFVFVLSLSVIWDLCWVRRCFRLWNNKRLLRPSLRVKKSSSRGNQKNSLWRLERRIFHSSQPPNDDDEDSNELLLIMKQRFEFGSRCTMWMGRRREENEIILNPNRTSSRIMHIFSDNSSAVCASLVCWQLILIFSRFFSSFAFHVSFGAP